MEQTCTETVIAKVAPEYRLRYEVVNEDKARQALNHRRPVVAKFTLFEEQWIRFKEFFSTLTTPKAILTRSNIGGEKKRIILVRC